MDTLINNRQNENSELPWVLWKFFHAVVIALRFFGVGFRRRLGWMIEKLTCGIMELSEDTDRGKIISRNEHGAIGDKERNI